MDLKSSNTSEFTEPYITSSKSTDFIKPKEEPDNFTPMVPKAEVYKVYKRRWAVYYGVSDVWIDWTSMVYMILYIPLIFPGSWFLDKMGLRITAVVGIFGTCIGSWVKVFAVQPHLFFLSFAGQSIVALSQVFILSLPARLAAVWFGPDQVSFACSVGVFGNQVNDLKSFAFHYKKSLSCLFIIKRTKVRYENKNTLIASNKLLLFYASITTGLSVI
uniref:Uncharacterized protein n=1 Tax=Glossina morsitans morsitans TaxID=37546 RepID=A0A1B0G294_GLOMM